LSSHLSDLLGMSGRDMLKALAAGQTDPAAIARLAQPEVRVTQAQLCDPLSAAASLSDLQRQILRLFLQRLELIESRMETLQQAAAAALRDYEDSVHR
jgi:hypothetical protein